MGFPGGSEVKASACNVGDLGSIPVMGRSPGEGNGNPLQYSCLANPMDGGAWWAYSPRATKSNFTFTFKFLLIWTWNCSLYSQLLFMPLLSRCGGDTLLKILYYLYNYLYKYLHKYYTITNITITKPFWLLQITDTLPIFSSLHILTFFKAKWQQFLGDPLKGF